jgi:[glutamine synthetase] adenylyltransferase / [glutamine synthetase]-adenylyl-L-tyrosine phosphorylase
MLPQLDELSHEAPSVSSGSTDSTDPLQLQLLIDGSTDPQRVTQYVNDFRARHSQVLGELEKDPERLRWLTVIFSSSRFLSEELSRHPTWILSVDEFQSTLTVAQYKSRLDRFLAERGIGGPSALDLALFRRKELLRIVLRDRLGWGNLQAVTEELSNLADAILDRALRVSMLELGEKYGTPLAGGRGEQIASAFTVLALGKLGGHELNYSSDIDLMFLYGENGDTSGPQRITNREFFKKVANHLTNLLSTYTGAGVCYRVDLRLRPEGTLGEVCISLEAAKDYYASRARDWELQMLIKARVAAGDEALGQELLTFVEPSIYSTSLDFSTIETMSETRERITEKLARKRLRKDNLDVKLARGGIRDIEFLVQCLQRLHGSRETWVRHGGTMLALSRLHDKDLLSVTEYSRLSDAYCFLRKLEHLLQFEDDRQTHALPPDPTDLERIARRMLPVHNRSEQTISVGAQLLKELNRHLESVQAIYERIVHAQRPLFYTPAPAAPAVNESPQKATAHEDTMIGSFTELLDRLANEAPRFAETVRSRGLRRSDDKLVGFLEYLLKNPAELQLLEGQPALADWTAQIFEVTPFLAEELASYPELLTELRRAVDHPTRRWAFEGLAAPLNDIGGLRRFFRREMFRILAGSVCLPEPVFQTLDSTSALAEFVIARAYRIALARAFDHAHKHATPDKPFHDPRDEMMVVALGRLGMREFDLGSDADLLFIIPDVEVGRQRFWTRVAEHLIDILTSYTGDGTILSLDTRLRPNGREGMLVQTESTYVEYFSSKAEAWEGIAYMKARGVAGDTERATQFLNELQQVDWRRYGQGGRSKHDLRQMRLRLQREQGQITPLKAAEGSYYDADFILMYLRLKGAGMFFKSLNTPERIDIVEKMGHLERSDAEFLQRATRHFRALDHAVRVVRGRSEEKIPAAPDQREMIVELMRRWTGERPTAANLDTHLLELQHKMRQLFDRVFA